jgi:carbon-monoxide dehydrogenase small subunit
VNITNQFEVKRPVDAVWAMFQDVPAVAQCLPGAALTDDKGDGAYAGHVEVKLGPMSAKFEGEATITPDAAAKSGHIEGKGADKAGGSRGHVKVDYGLTASERGTTVTVDANITLSGAIAQFGRTGLVEEMSRRLIDEFVSCLEAKMAAATPEEAAEIKASDVKGISLFFSALAAWIGSFFKRLFKRGDK